MADFEVTWVIDVEAESSEEAAKIAKSIMEDASDDNIAHVFYVRRVLESSSESRHLGTRAVVDLDEDKSL